MRNESLTTSGLLKRVSSLSVILCAIFSGIISALSQRHNIFWLQIASVILLIGAVIVSWRVHRKPREVEHKKI
jgi:hypothetical protein